MTSSDLRFRCTYCSGETEIYYRFHANVQNCITKRPIRLERYRTTTYHRGMTPGKKPMPEGRIRLQSSIGTVCFLNVHEKRFYCLNR